MKLINRDDIKFETLIVEKDTQSVKYRKRTAVAFKRDIDAIPTVEVPARHGKFIGTEYDGYADGCPVYCEWKCSECGCVFEDDEPTYNYCPNCGAKMESEEE